MAPTLNPPPNDTPAIKAIERTLHQRYRFELLDGRRLLGQLVCLDKQGNIILDFATEFPPLDDSAQRDREARDVGLILIPKKWWRSIELDTAS